MPPQSRAQGSLSQRRPENNTLQVEAAAMNRHRNDQRRANLEKIARYIIHPLSQSPYKHVGMDFLSRCRIKCKDMDFKTGQVGKQTEQFIQPIPPKVVQQWLDETRPPPKERRDIVNEYSHEFPNDNQWEATMIWRRINAPSNSRFVNRLGEENANWQLKGVLRQHLPNQSNYDRPLDPNRPHAICYLADGAEPVDDMLLTSELTTLLLMATDTALKATWQKHKLISVTLITGSYRAVRVSQCVLDAETGSIEIRKSPHITFNKGLLAEWAKYLTLMGWVLGKPAGQTV
ncbi:uncharacterized protein FFB20_06516 [Fusarium fujikuroi]|uniref:Uncharacterized protein n=1 Tax=Gibberella fujikuroi (strain CBS 195.34 / IMI 58289 / NRRL A-6831) TaxID=1279085 RepID=S0DUY7_GIBF5|nr:uncharacterized protein FFUJ_03290 [Fusarium fujikuroi IMI 58289]KLO94795.1 uncharacterized protein Y057_4521 [Fusarium fujikuroi]KLP17941.1 uncharacterized protein LW94_7668 [Fusarium fujikuroi]QGI62469.1 hypothetical protein CEK27_006440 [Fusarium fujikuroi]QGI79636.1 hypothetical protein CEK25_006365 [Fusarium fujikuroi]QGI93364.1 hypothetical protein CEK26_006433 [Fusarium fujikuroi]